MPERFTSAIREDHDRATTGYAPDPPMHIRGLIRALNSVRSQVAAGILPANADRFRGSVGKIVGQVEEICARNHMSPSQLPDPSRRAYEYLKNLDLANLPQPRDGAASPAPPGRIRIRNVVSTGDYYAGYFWQRVCHAAKEPFSPIDELIGDLQTHVKAIEEICAGHQATPAALETRSREVFSWLKFLCDPENLRSHLQGLNVARTELANLQPAIQPAARVEVHLIRAGNVLWRHRRAGDRHQIKVSEGFVDADPEVWGSLLSCALLGKDPAGSHVVLEYAASEDYGEVMAELDALVQSPETSRRGHRHDLDASFDRVNAAYFDGAMSRPVLVWNKVPTGAKFGHYRKQGDQVMLSITLDDPSVPEWVLDFVMYHELLHRKLGYVLFNGRRMSHTPDFRNEERRYARYQEAEEHLAALARRQR